MERGKDGVVGREGWREGGREGGRKPWRFLWFGSLC